MSVVGIFFLAAVIIMQCRDILVASWWLSPRISVIKMFQVSKGTEIPSLNVKCESIKYLIMSS